MRDAKSRTRDRTPSRRLTVSLVVLMLLLVSLVTIISAGASAPPAVQAGPDAAALGQGDVITIGIGAALTGPIPDLGARQANSAQLAVDQVNAAGGIDIGGTNYTLALVTADSACSGGQGAPAANVLVNAGVVAVVGHTCSGATGAALPVYDSAGIPLIMASATGSGLTEMGYTGVFRVISRDGSEGVRMATYFRQKLQLGAVALVQWTADMTEGADAFANTFTAMGGLIVSRRTVDSVDDFAATLTLIGGEAIDAIVYVDSSAARAGGFSNQARLLGMQDTVLGWSAWQSVEEQLQTYSDAAGSAVVEDYVGLPYRNKGGMPGYAAFATAYQAAGFPVVGEEPTALGAFAYDAVMIIVDAIERADSAVPADIRDAIAATTDYAGVVGAYDGFDMQGDVIPQWAWIVQSRDDRWRVLSLAEVYLPLVGRGFAQ